MITTLLVIQKVSENGKVEVFQIQHPVNFQWTFEAERKANADDKEYFPFKLMSNDVSITKRPAGNETKTRVNNNLIMFSDDYYVPDGSVISILFPSNFIPDIINLTHLINLIPSLLFLLTLLHFFKFKPALLKFCFQLSAFHFSRVFNVVGV